MRVVFSSIFFLLFFLPVFLTGYTLLGAKWRNHWLLLCSLLFYAYGAPKFLWVLLFSSLANFYLVGWMNQNLRYKRALLWLGILLNVGLLLVYKYANFGVEVAAELWGYNSDNWVDIALPIGISFFTFQSLSYNLDVFRGDEKPLNHPLHYLLYIFSFPQMIAGPIVRYGAVAQELEHRSYCRKNAILGAQRFIIGLAKKVLIANTVAAAFPIEFSETGHFAGAWTALLAYTIQIYFDFSGYSDMAIGLGQIMGFHFPENFDRPYNARSFTDFWRRWHKTLSFWMRDYLYIGMGGNRKGPIRTYVNLVLVFAISGFWHGASWNFLLWGLYHGTFLVLERAFLAKWMQSWPKLIAQIWTFFWVVLGWALFAIEDFEMLKEFVRTLFTLEWNAPQFGDKMSWFTMALAATVVVLPVYKYWERIFQSDKGGMRSWMAHLALALLSLAHLAGDRFNPFIYFRF